MLTFEGTFPARVLGYYKAFK